MASEFICRCDFCGGVVKDGGMVTKYRFMAAPHDDRDVCKECFELMLKAVEGRKP